MKFGPLPPVYKGILDRYWMRMPAEMQRAGKESIISLGEGATRLRRAKNLEQYLDDTYKGFKARVYLKLEGDNRGTKSFKDRGMTAAVTMAAFDKKKIAICVSAGDTLASAAAYCRAAGIKCFGLLPEGEVTSGKFLQAQVHGAEVLRVRGNFDETLRIAEDILRRNPDVLLLNSANPFMIEGQKSAAFEVVEELGQAPRFHILSGNAGNIAAYWQGYKESFAARPLAKMIPHIIGYQAKSAAPFGNHVRWAEANLAIAESHGKFDSVTDDEAAEAYKLVLALEPITCEPSSAISVAGLIKEVKICKGIAESSSPYLHYMMYIYYDCDIVCTLSGDGAKGPERVQEVFLKEPAVIDADYSAVMDIINSK